MIQVAGMDPRDRKFVRIPKARKAKTSRTCIRKFRKFEMEPSLVIRKA